MATILLVDDVELFLELERSFLASTGHRLVTLASGEETLERIEDIRPDLLLLDLYMPGIDGDEVCRRLRRHPAGEKLPILMVTAAGREEDVRKCLAAGCDDYITKPVGKQELVEKVQRLLGQVRTRTEERRRVDLRVQLRGAGKCLPALARDLSRNGIYVKSRQTLAPGSVVEVLLELPDDRQVIILGRVVRAGQGEEAGLGIYFIHPEPRGRQVLEDLAGECREELLATAPAATDPASTAAGEGEGEGEGGAVGRLQARIRELEVENQEFARQMIRTEELNNNLTNLYIASSRLHSVLSRSEVLEIVREVIINFVGAETFALLGMDQEGGTLTCEMAEGLEPGDFPVVRVGEGCLGEVAASRQSYFVDGPVSAGSGNLLQPLAAIPLVIHGEALGVLAIYRLFIQKERFEAIDYQLFSMMAEHAATALFSSTLYEASERQRQTYRGVMDLLLK